MPPAVCDRCGEPYDAERDRLVVYSPDQPGFRCAPCTAKQGPYESERTTPEQFLNFATRRR
jgi:hypothetical protein